ncbi:MULTISPECIES: hypothetical protein [Streptomyces]|uniref:hypothetical protein n=1 Tax=Streptomyces TaxID=1883 RepID=UPI00200D0BD7|nr:hypothetical protein [Streptomyces sp. LRE541]UPZ29181.1 hypothetical protein MUK60_16015 [Streptomyces sp. LRE541]
MEITRSPDGPPPRAGIEIHRRIGSWKVTMWRPADSVGGGPQEIRIEPHEDGDPQEIARGLSSTVLRQIDTRSFVEMLDTAPTGIDQAVEEEAGLLRGWLADAPRGVTDRYLAMLSAVYVRVVEIGERAPIQALEEITNTKQATLKGHLRAARKRGFLTKVEGKAGGQLTEKADEVLRGMKSGAGTEEV